MSGTEPEIESSSPACAIGEADDVYMGYAGRDELIEALFRLLAVAPEERWRSMLAGHLLALQGPTAATAPPAGEPVETVLRNLLPRVRDYRLHADLSAMLRAYDAES